MENKTEEQLVEDIKSLRQEVAELKQEKAERKRAERLLQGLNEASRSMEQALTPDEIFSAVAGELEKLGFRCAVFLTDQGRRRLFLKYWSYETAAIKAAERLVGRKHEDFPILIEAVDEYGKTVWERQTVFIENVKDVIRQLFQPVLPGPSKKLAGPVAKLLKVSKDINAPLIAGDEVVGMLSVQSGDLTRDDMPAITAFAYQMAAAWHKATLLQDLKRNLAERNRAEEALQKAHDELERRVEERTAELVESNEQLTREITERKRAEEALRDSEQRTKAMLESIGDHMSMMDKDLNIVWANDVAKRIFGDDIVGKKCYASYHGRTKPCEPYPCLTLKAFQDGKVHEHDTQVIDKDGKIVDFHCTANVALRDRDGKPAAVIEISRDITERKKAEEAVRESEKRYRTLFESKLDGMAVIDAETMRIVLANQAAAEMYGFSSAEEGIGVNPLDFVASEEGERTLKIMVGDMFEKDLQEINEFRTITKDGKEKWISAVGIRIEYEGKLAGLVSFRDITERKRAEEVLQTYKSMVESAHDAIFFKDLDSRYVMANAKTLEAFGLSREEVIGKNDRELMTNQEEAKKNIEDDQLIFKTKKPTEITKHMTGADGKEYWFRAIKVPQFDEKGNIMGLVGVARDITERKNREEQLVRLSNAVKMSTDSIVMSDLEGNIIEANEATLKLYGTDDKGDLIGKNSFDLIAPEDREKAFAGMEEARERGYTQGQEYRIITKDGSRVPVEMDVAIMKDVEGKAVGFVGVSRDITARKRAEEKLKASLEEKELLLKEIHHRVKNNLQVISSLLKLQSGYVEDERYTEMFKESQGRVRSMALVHEKLYQSGDLARIDLAGYIEDLGRQLLRSYGSEAARVAIKAEVEDIRLGVDQAIPCGLIINELVSNSLKHAFLEGEGGEIRIAMRQVGEDEVELEVSDNGIGLPESVGVRNAESLGLRLVSMLAEDQLVGEIKVDRGKGTRFRIGFRVS